MGTHAPKIAVIGGGTGSFTLLQELKEFTTNIDAIVNMSDDGGSTGILRDELGVLPPGDIRQCLVALSDTPEVRELFSYRFGEGTLAGQSLGNVILSGLELHYGSFDRAIKVASDILHIVGKVIPITLDNHTLVMRDGDEVIKGEYLIGHRALNHRDVRIELESFGKSKAKKIVVSNLVTKPGQTTDWHVVDYVDEFEKYLGKDAIDYVIYNSEPPSPELLGRYAEEGEFPVSTSPDRFKGLRAKQIGTDLVAKEMKTQDKNDTLIKRTLIRHDANKVSRELMKLFYE